MKNVSFDSHDKFIVSIGIILLLSPFSIIYFFITSSDMLISVNDMNNLTDTSKQIVYLKQSTFLKIFDNCFFYIVIILSFFCGIYLIINGLRNWKVVQKDIDSKIKLENEKVKLENKKLENEIGLSEKEKQIKVEKEIDFDKKILGEKEVNYTNSEYMNIEKGVVSKIKEIFDETHEIVAGAKINNMEYDLIARGKGFLDKDYIFEIKYVQKQINKLWLEKVTESIKKQAINYSKATNRLPYKLIIVITENENFDIVKDMINRQSKINNLRYEVVQKDNISNFKL